MSIGSEHEVKESTGGSIETIVVIGTGNVMDGMSSEEVGESHSGVGYDGGDSDCWVLRSINFQFFYQNIECNEID